MSTRNIEAAKKQLAAATRRRDKADQDKGEAQAEIDRLTKRLHWLQQDPEIAGDVQDSLDVQVAP